MSFLFLHCGITKFVGHQRSRTFPFCKIESPKILIPLLSHLLELAFVFLLSVILIFHMLCMSWNHTLIVYCRLIYPTVTWCHIPECIAICVLHLLPLALFPLCKIRLLYLAYF